MTAPSRFLAGALLALMVVAGVMVIWSYSQ